MLSDIRPGNMLAALSEAHQAGPATQLTDMDATTPRRACNNAPDESLPSFSGRRLFETPEPPPTLLPYDGVVDLNNDAPPILSPPMPRLPTAGVKRGRPTNSKKTNVIGVHKAPKLETKAISFRHKSKHGKAKVILKVVLVDPNILRSVLEYKFQVEVGDLEQDLSKLKNSLKDPEINAGHCLRAYCTNEAYVIVEDIITRSRKQAEVACETCKLLVHKDDDEIKCASCLIRFHARCVGKVRATKRAWFCSECQQ